MANKLLYSTSWEIVRRQNEQRFCNFVSKRSKLKVHNKNCIKAVMVNRNIYYGRLPHPSHLFVNLLYFVAVWTQESRPILKLATKILQLILEQFNFLSRKQPISIYQTKLLRTCHWNVENRKLNLYFLGKGVCYFQDWLYQFRLMEFDQI